MQGSFIQGFACLPHARGGVSTVSLCIVRSHKSSPRTWGCFLDCRSCVDARKVFPTHVGVFPGRGRHCRSAPCLPHARGGVSACTPAHQDDAQSSPRTWGCFTLGAGLSGFGIVFPTHVGGGAKQGLPPKAPSPQLGLFTSALDIDSFIWRE